MILKYISTWWVIIFYIWLIGKSLNIKYITDNINVYYITFFLFFGFIGINFYYTQYLKRSFDPKLWIILLYYHISPFVILILLNQTNHKGSIKTLLISILLYLVYIIYNKESIYNIYFIEKIPQSWEEINIRCKNEKNKKKLFCQLNSYKERYL